MNIVTHTLQRRLAIITVVSATTLAGCAGMNKPEIGKGIGGLAGAAAGFWAGSKFDKSGDTGKILGGIGGALIGAWIGNEIGQYLDDQEQLEAAKAATDALNSDKLGAESTKTWNSPTKNITGGTTVTQKMTTADGRVCKATNNFITYKGRDVETAETYCRDNQSGRWILQQA